MKSESSKYIVLLSGGLDSVVNLYAAHGEGVVTLALTFDYGQRAAKPEIRAARFFCEKLGIPHKVIELEWLRDLTKTALVDSTQSLPHLSNLDDLREARSSAQAVWVPNRNGVFLNIGASYAEALGAEFVIPGFNSEEAATFPDNSMAFIEASTRAFGLSTLFKVKVACFTSTLDKKQMVQKARELKVDLSKVWSCYRDGDRPCGKCESCQRFARAQSAESANK